MNNLSSISGGLGSAYSTALLVERLGPNNVTGVFTDVNGEHPDNYRFLAEVQYELGIRVVKITNDGRNIWDVMKEARFLANTRVDICSRILKREAMATWLKANCDPADTTIHLGIDWMEMHRFDRAKPLWAKAGWNIAAPLCEPPYKGKGDAQAWLDSVGIKRPALYDMGFEHANCGGGCVKAGIKQFKKLLVADRRWYVRWWEAGEEGVREFLGRDDIAILRDRSMPSIIERLGYSERQVEARFEPHPDEPDHSVLLGHFVKATGQQLPTTLPLTLRSLRERVDAEATLFDNEPDEPGCGVCFVGPESDDDREAA